VYRIQIKPILTCRYNNGEIFFELKRVLRVFNLLFILFIILELIGSSNPLFASSTDSSNIKFSEKPSRWTLSTNNATYQIIISRDSNLVPGYFGPDGGTRVFDAPSWDSPKHTGAYIREIPYRGGFVEMTPSVEVVFSDHVRELDLVYTGYSKGMKEGYPYIRFDMEDKHYPFKVSEYIRVIPELDIFEKWLVLKNTGEKSIKIERAYSGSVVLPSEKYDFLHLSGDWGREFYPRITQLTSGKKSIFSRGMRFHQHTPFFMARPHREKGKNNGNVWFGSVAWSGNWIINAEVNRMERTQISGGINFWDTHWILDNNEEFQTPKMTFGVSQEGSNGASSKHHKYILDHILPSPLNREVHKILYNSWYATTFDVNVEQQLKLAKIASKIGVERFAIDDGWFKGRNDGNSGLGDWVVDREKFPNGLSPMIEKINKIGLDFGLWVEPEMASYHSNLYRKHPEWILHTPHRPSHYSGRHQYTLNLAREDVKNYIMKSIDELLSKYNIKFIKWDYNRNTSEMGWPEAPPEKKRELRIRYVRNLYEILQTLRKKHPDVVFEGCAGGGGRVDPGILNYVDQVWPSDNTDPGDRMHIQYGFSYAYPAKIMTNWVTDHEWHQETTPLEFRFHVAMAGNLGVGSDLLQWGKDEIATAKQLIQQYKNIRHIIQLGDTYRIRSPFKGNSMAVQYVTRDKEESVVFHFQTLETTPMAEKGGNFSKRLILKGLDPNGTYMISGEHPKQKVSGDALMKSGVRIPLDGNYSSKVVVLEKIK